MVLNITNCNTAILSRIGKYDNQYGSTILRIPQYFEAPIGNTAILGNTYRDYGKMRRFYGDYGNIIGNAAILYGITAIVLGLLQYYLFNMRNPSG